MTKEQLKHLVSKDYLNEVFEILKKVSTPDSKLHNMVITQSSSFRQYRWSSNLGTISRPDEKLEHAQVVNRLLSVIDELPDSWLERTAIPPRLSHLFETEPPTLVLPPISKSPLTFWILGGVLALIIGLAVWFYQGRVNTPNPGTSSSSVTSTPKETQSTSPLVSSASTTSPEPKKVDDPRANLPISTPKSTSLPSSFIGKWQTILAATNNTKTLNIKKEGTDLEVEIIGAHGSMEKHFAEVVSERKLKIEDFTIQGGSTKYKNVSIVLQSNSTIIIHYDAHLANGTVVPVEDTMKKE